MYNPRNEGMSTLDLLLVLVMFVIVGVAFVTYAIEYGFMKTMLSYVVMLLLIYLLLAPLWIYNDRKDKQRLKGLYERGMVEESHYRNLVGEKFYQKHHADTPVHEEKS